MKNVLLVFGGKSYEHDISVVTASQIISRTKFSDIRIVPLYVSRQNKLLIYEAEKFDISDFSTEKFTGSRKKFKEVAFVSHENNIVFSKTRFGLKEYLRADVAIFACHGGDGENGKLVSVFESVNIACSAGNFDALAVCMNKFLFKQVMKGLKLPVVPGFKISKIEYEDGGEAYQKKLSRVRFPAVIKPNNGGSSIGLFVADNIEEFKQKIDDAFEFDNEVLVEKYIGGCREFNVAVMGNAAGFTVSEVDEPLKQHEILSFSDKYLSSDVGKGQKLGGGVKNSMVGQMRKFPADIPESLSLYLKKIAAAVFTDLNLSGVVRIDFLYDEKNDKKYICEVNSIPGSLAYYFFNQKKIILNDFVLKLIDCAMQSKGLAPVVNEKFLTEILK